MAALVDAPRPKLGACQLVHVQLVTLFIQTAIRKCAAGDVERPRCLQIVGRVSQDPRSSRTRDLRPRTPAAAFRWVAMERAVATLSEEALRARAVLGLERGSPPRAAPAARSASSLLR